MPVEDSNRAFLIQSQASCQIDERAKISAGNSLVRRRIASSLVRLVGLEPTRPLQAPVSKTGKATNYITAAKFGAENGI